MPHRDPAALADAVRRILTEPGLAAGLAGRVRRWPPSCAGRRWRPGTRRSPTRLIAAGRPRSARCRRDRDRGGLDVDAAAAPTATPAPSFAHLTRLSDDTGLFEHARHAIVRREHGYCTDDVARGLVVASREPDPTRRRCSGSRSATWRS